MAVSKTQDWATLASGSAEPSGSVTIGGGTNRTLIFVHGFENSGQSSTSCGIGGIDATGKGTVFWESGGAGDLQIDYFYWDEDSLQSMSGTGISHAETNNIQKRGWTYATFSSCDQTSPVVNTTAVSASVNNSPGLTVATTGNSADFVAIVGMRDTQNRTFGSFGNLTEVFDADISLARFGLGDGQWQANNETVTGDSIQDVMLLSALVIKALSGNPTGNGSLAVTAATVSGSGDVGVNDLKPAFVTVAGVGERKVVWQGGVELTAPSPTVSTTAAQHGGTGPVESLPVEIFGVGQRDIVITGACSAVPATMSGSGKHGFIGTGSCTAAISLVSGDALFDALWFTRKNVYF